MSAITETIKWTPVAEALPDADLTVLIATLGCEEPTWLGYLDGEQWRDIDGSAVEVTHWAELMQGPHAQQRPFAQYDIATGRMSPPAPPTTTNHQRSPQ
jgi:hypothetical protein